MILPPLYAVLDVDACARAGRAPAATLRAFLDAGVTLVQVRAKHAGAADLLRLSTEAVALAAGRARVIVNDRADIAALAGADGVHVGQDDLPVADARRLLGDEALIGLSTHSAGQAKDALVQPIDYLAVGPVFDTRTKETGYEPVGLELVREAARLAAGRVPVVAIGGITLDRAPAVIAAGAQSACVIGDLLTGDPGARARAFLGVLGVRGPGGGSPPDRGN